MPVELPRAATLTYLGIQFSYGSFEMQSCLHRLRAARLVCQRLVYCMLPAYAYVSAFSSLAPVCVAYSSMVCMHAIGITPQVLRRLEASDARFVRAIARDPVHFTRTSNQDHRLKLQGMYVF